MCESGVFSKDIVLEDIAPEAGSDKVTTLDSSSFRVQPMDVSITNTKIKKEYVFIHILIGFFWIKVV
jgi:hypothetical protein